MHKGGGVGIYVKDIISFSVCDELKIMEEKLFESIFIKVIFGGKSIIIICGAIYRTPNLETNGNDIFLLNLKNCLSEILPSCNCVIGGDFNYNLLNHEDKFENRFVDSMYENAFCSMIIKPTITTDMTATVLT